MTGVTQSLFVPLSLAVAFAMAASFLLSSSFLPVMFLWVHKQMRGAERPLSPGVGISTNFAIHWCRFLDRLVRVSMAGIAGIIASPRDCGHRPTTRTGAVPEHGCETNSDFRIDAPVGTRAEANGTARPARARSNSQDCRTRKTWRSASVTSAHRLPAIRSTRYFCGRAGLMKP